LKQFDPVRLEIMWGALSSIAEEMGITLKRTAYSEMVREANDFSCAIFDQEGNMIGQSDHIGSPGHLGSIRDAVKIMLKEYPAETLQSGDSLITNDPYLVAGHLPDIAITSPIFIDSQLSGFALNITHHTDIGGRVAGGHIADSREIFEEGFRIPIMKYQNAGVTDKGVLKMIESNVRIPYKEVGDLNAQLSSNYVGSVRFAEFIREFRLSLDNFRDFSAQVIQTSEAAMQESYGEMREGNYTASEFIESFDGDDAIPMKVEVSVRKERVIVDYKGTGKQSTNGINSPYNYTYAYTSHAVKCATNSRVPMNEGVMKTIQMHAPEGTLLNPKFPAAVGGRHLTNWHVNSLVFRALAKAAPSRIIAPSGGTGSNMPQFSGIYSRTGKPFVQIVNHSGGLGARPDKDGISGYPFPARAENTPLEILENASPLKIIRFELLKDSGGAGQFRGGLGLVIEVKVTNKDGVTLLNISGRDRFPATGLFGGLEGGKSQILLKKFGKGAYKKLHPRRIAFLNYGDEIRFTIPGGGGYGPPTKRDLLRISEDIRAGYISAKAAISIYGVSRRLLVSKK
jgi:N-methylhydantoinase B